MTRAGFLAMLAALLASAATGAAAQPVRVPPQNPPSDAPGRVRGTPAPLLGAGLPALIAAGAALAGWRLWRRQRGPIDD